jgi:hypothetical protein
VIVWVPAQDQYLVRAFEKLSFEQDTIEEDHISGKVFKAKHS